MEPFHIERIEGKEGKLFEVRLFDYGATKQAALNRIIEENGKEDSVNVTTYDFYANVSLQQIMNAMKVEVETNVWTSF